MLEKLKKIIVPLFGIAIVVLLAGAFLYLNQNKAKVLSVDKVGARVMQYIKENVSGGETASLVDIVMDGDVYKLKLEINGQEYESYASRDGRLLFPEGYIIEEASTSQSAANAEIVKSDKPDVKLFVMSYCPFGLQAQKMFLPVYDLLKDKADMGVYFVDYIMHEKDEMMENLRQYCIQKEDKGKYSNYLACFTVSGDSEKCLSEAGINKGQIENCMFETDQAFSVSTLYNNKETWLNGQFPQFNVQKELNDQYGVQGSPTIVINDKVVEVSPRSPEKFKETICQAFNSAPEECSQKLSEDVPSSGIGGGTGSSSGGGCGQ